MPYADIPTFGLAIRGAHASDQSYVASTWQHALRDAGYEEPAALVDTMLDRRDVKVLLACERDRPDSIVGWLAFTPMPHLRLLHFVYVRGARRGQGIARQLANAAWPGEQRDLAFTMRGRMHRSLTGQFRDAIQMDVKEFLKP